MVAELIYSEEGLRNRAIFIKNDINIYIEDTGKEYLYEEVFKRLFNGKYKINAIFSLGGKINVLKEFIRKGNKDSKGNPNIFLLDGDFDKYIGYPEVCRKDFTYDVNNEQKLDEFVRNVIIKSDSVIYLDTYNFESFIIDEIPIIKHVQGKVQKREPLVSTLVNYNQWKERIVSESKDLFLLYLFVNKYLFLYGSMYKGKKSKLSIPTIERPHFLFLDNKTGFKKISQSFDDFRKEILLALGDERPELDLDTEINIIDSQYRKQNGENYYNLICGKFLLNSLNCHLTNVCRKKFDLQMLKWDLVRNFDVNKLTFLKELIDTSIM